MSDTVIYPADNVDATGKAWGSIGENIRHGKKVNNHFGLKWNTGTIMLHEGVLTASGVEGASLNVENKAIFFTEPIAITDFNVAILEKSPEASSATIPMLGVDSAGGNYITNISDKFKAILFEFEYRGLS